MYFADVESAGGRFRALDMTPLKIQRFRLTHASRQDVDWLRQTLDRESALFGSHVAIAPEGRLRVLLKVRAFPPTQLSGMQGRAHSPSGHTRAGSSGKRRRRYSYDEGVDEPGKLIEIESVEVEAEVPAEENEPVERIEKPDKPDAPAFEED